MRSVLALFVTVTVAFAAVTFLLLGWRTTSTTVNVAAPPVPQAAEVDCWPAVVSNMLATLTDSTGLRTTNITRRFEDFAGNESLKRRVFDLATRRDAPGIYYWTQSDDACRIQFTALVVSTNILKWAHATLEGPKAVTSVRDVKSMAIREEGGRVVLTVNLQDGAALEITECISVGA